MKKQLQNLILGIFLFSSFHTWAQDIEYQLVKWSEGTNVSQLSGVYRSTVEGTSNGSVNVQQTGEGNSFTYTSPYNGTDMIGTYSYAFVTQNDPSVPSKELTFNFSSPVYIHALNMGDINRSNLHNDSFTLRGVEFTDVELYGMNGTVNSGTATSLESGYGIWKNSTQPVTSFTIRFHQTNGVTHSYVKYALAVGSSPGGINEHCPTCPFYNIETLNLCSDQPYTFVADLNSPDYIYKWSFTNPIGIIIYLLSGDRNHVMNGNTMTTTTPFEGRYTVEIKDAEGNCIGTQCWKVQILPFITPTFRNLPISMCPTGPIPELPTTSLNGISGVWNVGNETSAYVELRFTPTRAFGECYNPTSHHIQKIWKTPEFEQIEPVCKISLINLPETSTNNISGTWALVSQNVTEVTYEFTPNPDECALPLSMTIAISDKEIPSFKLPQPFCENQLDQLPTTSTNSIEGSWHFISEDDFTMEYQFVPDDEDCYQSFTLTVHKLQDPLFNSHQAVCTRSQIELNTMSLNNHIGTWEFKSENATVFIYTFIPEDSCVNPYEMAIERIPIQTPTFSFQQDAYCEVEQIELPEISNNQIEGNWTIVQKSESQVSFKFTPTDQNCYASFSKTFQIFDKKPGEIEFNCSNGVFKIHSIQVYKSYQWFINGIYYDHTKELSIPSYQLENFTLPIEISLVATDDNNCTVASSIVIDDNYCAIQKGISPNQDGFNDFFDLSNLKVDQISIFNRYGVEVYKKHNYSNEWFGQSNQGNLLPIGTYYYTLHLKDGRAPITGWITLTY